MTPTPELDIVSLAQTQIEQYQTKVLIDAITKLKILCEHELLKLRK